MCSHMVGTFVCTSISVRSVCVVGCGGVGFCQY